MYVRAQNCFFIFTNLQIEAITYAITVHFPDYAFHENIDMYFFHEWDITWYIFSYDTQKLKNKSHLSLEKKRNFCLDDFR